MTDKQRIKGRPVAIDYESTLAFFEGRAAREYRNALSSTMYQDQQPELVEERDRREKLRVAPGLALGMARRVLDIGCGIGRWGWLLAEEAPQADYLGIDFSAALVEKACDEARQRGYERLLFQRMSATDIRPAELALSPPTTCCWSRDYSSISTTATARNCCARRCSCAHRAGGSTCANR